MQQENESASGRLGHCDFVACRLSPLPMKQTACRDPK